VESVAINRAQSFLEKMSRVLVPLVCLEVGIFLIFVPWTILWSNNMFAGWAPAAAIWPNGFFKGAVSGLGLINLWIGAQEAYQFWKNW
jgi:hypothetical protein